MSEAFGATAITEAIESANGPAICAYLTAGYPTLDLFPELLRSVARSADVVEVGVPFTDPMADGLTIQRASHVALNNGVNLNWIFDLLSDKSMGLSSPHLLMGYYNPFLARGLERLGESMTRSGTSGLIVPDLPIEESGPLAGVLSQRQMALVQLVTPTTPPARLQRLSDVSDGFVYAVTTTGVTGGDIDLSSEDVAYLERVREGSPLPVLAGFGIRSVSQVAMLASHTDGVVVGSALINAIDRGEDPGLFIDSLRVTEVSA